MNKHDDFWFPIFSDFAQTIFGLLLFVIVVTGVCMIGATIVVVVPILLFGGLCVIVYKFANARGAFDPPKPIAKVVEPEEWDERHLMLELGVITEDIRVLKDPPDYMLRRLFGPMADLLMTTDRTKIETTTVRMKEVLNYLLTDVEFPGKPTPFSAPLFEMCKRPARDVVHSATILFHQQPGFENYTKQIDQNLCMVSGIAYYARYELQDRIIWPQDSKLTGKQLVSTYVKGTALEPFLLAQIPLAIPDKQMIEHSFMCAPSGHGKSQTLQAWILSLLARHDVPGMFIIDSHGDMLPKIERLAKFTDKLKDRLVIIDPEDIAPPALNFLDFSGNEVATAELFAYLMSALSSDLTSKQSTVVAFILRLMAVIPDATLNTLREVMEDPAKTVAQSKFVSFINTLDPISQSFFATQFYNNQMNVTKQAVARRIYSLLANRTFATMFGATKNKFSAFDAMQQKKIVIINTSAKLLRGDSAVFGRFMLAQILSAAYDRVNVPESERHPTYIIVDEAAQYLDEQIESILTETRKYGVGIVLATQYIEQIPPGVKAAIYGNTATKVIGPVAYSDAHALGREMYTSGEFIRSMKKEDGCTRFALFSRGITPSAIEVSVPFGVLEQQPKMSDADHAAIRQLNRERFGISGPATVRALMPPPAHGPRSTPPPLPTRQRDPSMAADY